MTTTATEHYVPARDSSLRLERLAETVCARYHGSMDIRVEFYGIPRSRAGVACARLEFATPTATLAQVVCELAQRFPDFGQQCADGGRLAPEVVANVSGDRFVRDGQTTIRDGETLLLLSADAGG